MSASSHSVRLGGPRHGSLRERVAAGVAVALFAAAAFLTFGHAEHGTVGTTSAPATRVGVADTRWVPKWTAASARAAAAESGSAMDPRWLPKQHLDTARTSRT
ncbi:MAG: hypothetical protein ACM3WR_11585 [Solirubrobacterales bacterium]